MIELLDRSIAPEQRYFKIRVDDVRVFLLRHDDGVGIRQLAALVGSVAPGSGTGRAPR